MKDSVEMKKTMQVYQNIYDVVEGNLAAAGEEFEYQKSTFLCEVGSHPQTIDLSDYTGLSNPQFFQAVYVSAYKRLPGEKTIRAWEKNYGMEREAFQKKALRSISGSVVVAINHIRFINHPSFRQHIGFRYRALGHLYGITHSPSLRKLGKSFPAPIQGIIRKIFI